MKTIPQHEALTRAAETGHSQVRNLLEVLDSLPLSSPSLTRLVTKLRQIEQSMASLTPANPLGQRPVQWAIDLTELLSSSRTREIPRPAYLAVSRLAAALLVISQLDETDDASAYLEALHQANCEIAAQCLILEVSHEPQRSLASSSFPLDLDEIVPRISAGQPLIQPIHGHQ